MRSPLHYWAKHVDPNRIETSIDSPALRFGPAAHMAVLEQQRFRDTYHLGPQVSRATKTWKDAAKACAGTLLPPDEYQALVGIQTSLRSHPSASKALFSDGGISEATFIANGLKCRADRVTKSGKLVDLKTTQDASAAAFAKSVANFNYHIQAAFYMHVVEMATGTRPKGFAFVAVEKAPPYACQVFVASDSMLAEGFKQVYGLLERKDKLEADYGTDPWPSYSDRPVSLDLPSWAIK